MAAAVGRDGLHSIKGLLCDLCGREASTEEQSDLNSLTCTFSRCPDQSSVYHQDCLDKYLRKLGLERNRRTGFKCPRGSGKGTQYDSTCPGRIDKSHPIHHRNEVAKQAAKASRETLPQKLTAKPAPKPASKKAGGADRKTAPVPVSKPAASKVHSSTAVRTAPPAPAASAAPASPASELKARIVAERQGLKYRSLANAVPAAKLAASRSRDIRPRKASVSSRQQSSLRSALESSSGVPASKPEGQAVLHQEAKAGPLHAGPAARMAAGAAAIRSQAPVGLEAEETGDDKLTKTQRRLMRRSERRAAQRVGPDEDPSEGNADAEGQTMDIEEGSVVGADDSSSDSPNASPLPPSPLMTGMLPIEEEPEAVSSADQEADEILAPLVQAASAESVIQQPSQELGYSASGLDLSPTLSQTSPENAVIGVTGHEEEAEMHGEAVPQQALQDALVLAEARRLMDQLQQIGFPVWQAAAAVQHSGANLEQGIAFLLEGHLDNEAAAYRYLEAAGDKLPDIDVSGAMHQVREMAVAFGLEQEALEAAVLEASGNINEGLQRLLSDGSSSQHSSPCRSAHSLCFESPMSSSLGRSSSLHASQGPSSAQPSPARSGYLAGSRPSFEVPSYESSPRIPHHSSPQHSLWSSPSPHLTTTNFSPMYTSPGPASKPPSMTAMPRGSSYQYQQVYGFQRAPDVPHAKFLPPQANVDQTAFNVRQHQHPSPVQHGIGSAAHVRQNAGFTAQLDPFSPGHPFNLDLAALSAFPGDSRSTATSEVPQAALLAAAAIASEPEMPRRGKPLHGETGVAQQNQDLTSLVAALTCR